MTISRHDVFASSLRVANAELGQSNSKSLASSTRNLSKRLSIAALSHQAQVECLAEGVECLAEGNEFAATQSGADRLITPSLALAGLALSQLTVIDLQPRSAL